MSRFKYLLLFFSLLLFTSSYSQEPMKFPLKAIMKVGDGYLIAANLLKEKIEFFLCDSEMKRVSTKKMRAAIIFTYDDKSTDFNKDLKLGSKNIFIAPISNEKSIDSIYIMIILNGTQYNAAWLYPEAMKTVKKTEQTTPE